MVLALKRQKHVLRVLEDAIPEGSYDYVLIDSQPNYSLLSASAILYAQNIVVIMKPELFSFLDVRYLFKIRKTLAEKFNVDVRIVAALINFVVSKSIEIDCEVKGKLDVESQIVIQKNGFVNADVKTTDAEIIGRFDGSMEARGNVEIKDTGVVYGNIKTDSLIINKGGIFSGNVTRMTDAANVGKKPAIDPLRDHGSGKDEKLSL